MQLKAKKTETLENLLKKKKIVKGWSPVLSQLYSLDSAIKDENPQRFADLNLELPVGFIDFLLGYDLLFSSGLFLGI